MDFVPFLDEQTLDLFTRCWGSRWDAVMIDLSALGGRSVLMLVVFFSFGLLACMRRYRTAGFLLAAALSGALLAVAVKHLIQRPRPVRHLVVLSDQSYSFPSGHSMLSALIYLTLALILAETVTRRVRTYLIGSSLVLVFLIGVSRMYLGVHYLTDVVGGWAAGLGWALMCRWIESHWVLRAERKAAIPVESDAVA